MNTSENKHPNPEINPETQDSCSEIGTQETVAQPATSASDPDYKELLLRTNADFQNFKRRVERERAEWTSLMQANVLEKFLPFVQDLERAVQVAQPIQGQELLLEGFQLILKNLKKTLTDMGVTEIETTGEFNPEFHEALMHVESPDHASGHIVQELSKGYCHKGKVLKHARVSVAK